MKIRVGIIGCGSISEFRHAPEYFQNPNAEIAAYYDVNKERAEMLAGKYGGKVVDSYKAIIEDPTISAVSICSPNYAHCQQTVEAFQNGKHVLCEKPLAVTPEEAEEMLEAGRKAGKKLMVGHNQRLADAHIKAKEILKSGELGKVLTFRAIFGHKGPEFWSENKSNGTWFFDKGQSVLGVTGDIGVHKIDIIRYLLDDEFTEVNCIDGTLDKVGPDGAPIGVIDNMICLVRTEKGSMGTITASWTYYGPENNSVTLYCENGIMRIYDDPDYQIIVQKLNKEDIFYKVGEIQTNDKQSSSGIIDSFIDCIINDKNPAIGGEEGVKSIKIVAAAIEAAKTGRTVKVQK